MQRITDVLLPQSRPRYGKHPDTADASAPGSSGGGGPSWGPAERYLFIVCGADADDEKATKFSRLLGSALRFEGVPVALGFKPTENTMDEE